MTVGRWHLDLRALAVAMAAVMGLIAGNLASWYDPTTHPWVPFAVGIVAGAAGLLRLASSPAAPPAGP